MYIRQQMMKVWGCLYPMLIYVLAQQIVLSVIVPVYTDHVMSAVNANNNLTVNTSTLNFINEHTVALTSLSAVIAIPILLFFYISDRKKRKVIVLPSKSISWKYIFVIAAAFCSSISLSFITTMFSLSEKVESYGHVNDVLFNEPLIIQILGTGLIVPLAEELVFRGLIQNRIRTLSGSGYKALIFTGILFGIFHDNIVQAAAASATGLVIGFIYEKYGSLFAPVLFHICFNLPSILMQYMNFTVNSLMILIIAAAAGFAITVFIVYLLWTRILPDPIYKA